MTVSFGEVRGPAAAGGTLKTDHRKTSGNFWAFSSLPGALAQAQNDRVLRMHLRHILQKVRLRLAATYRVGAKTRYHPWLYLVLTRLKCGGFCGSKSPVKI